MIQFSLNGSEVLVDDSEPANSLLNVLRDELGVYTPKNACTQGECGSCSVLFNGKVICSCLMPICSAEGGAVVTMEGLEEDREAAAIRSALTNCGGIQCGFCTPGIVVTSTQMLKADPSVSRDAMRDHLAGNLCRCTGYTKILDGIEAARNRLAEGEAMAASDGMR